MLTSVVKNLEAKGDPIAVEAYIKNEFLFLVKTLIQLYA